MHERPNHSVPGPEMIRGWAHTAMELAAALGYLESKPVLHRVSGSIAMEMTVQKVCLTQRFLQCPT